MTNKKKFFLIGLSAQKLLCHENDKRIFPKFLSKNFYQDLEVASELGLILFQINLFNIF